MYWQNKSLSACLPVQRESKCKGVVRDTFILGTEKAITLSEGSQVSPARPSGRSMKIKIYEEEFRTVTVVA